MKIPRLSLLYFSLVILTIAQIIHAHSLVYNLKLRRVVGAGISALIGKETKAIWAASAVPLVYVRDRHIVDHVLGVDINICEDRKSVGSIFNLRYVPSYSNSPGPSWWVEVTTAVEKEFADLKGTTNFCISKTGLDDIVFEGGYNYFPSEHSQITGYGIFGFPTTHDVDLFDAHDPLVGSRFYGAGLGAEVSYSFIATVERSLVIALQARLVHFFTRSWDPILAPGEKVQPGNVTDFLLSIFYREKKNLFEVGYNPTIFSNQAALLKVATIEGETHVRHSFYASYDRYIDNFPLFNKSGTAGTGFSFSRNKRFETKTYTVWVAITIAF